VDLSVCKAELPTPGPSFPPCWLGGRGFFWGWWWWARDRGNCCQLVSLVMCIWESIGAVPKSPERQFMWP